MQKRSSKKQRKRDIKAEIRQAICYDEFEKVKELLPYINNSKYNEKLKDLLCYSVSKNAMDIFEYFVKTMNIEFMNNDIGCTILYMLVEKKILHTTDLSAVLPLTKNINYQTKYNYTILYLLIKQISGIKEYDLIESYKNTIKLLLEHGANPYIKDIHNQSVIDYAILSSPYIKIDICMLLLDNNIDKYVDIGTLYMLVWYGNGKDDDDGDNYDRIELLLPHIKDINKLYEGHSILWYAKNTDRVNDDIIELLEKNGALLLLLD